MKKPRDLFTIAGSGIVVCMVLLQTITVTCQRTDNINTLLRKPPDLRKRIIVQQNAISQTNDTPRLAVGNYFNKRPMVFRCNDMVPLFAARRNIQSQTGSSPLRISVTPSETIPGTVMQGLYL